MRRLNYGLLLLSLATCAIGMTGCGADTVDTEYVQGLVTLDGDPVAEATVMFTPVEEGKGAAASGYTDENGVYKLTAQTVGGLTAAAQGGTLPGEYYVGVSKYVTEEAMSEEEAYDAGVAYVPVAPGEEVKTTHLVPEKYNNPKESGLKVTVQAGQNDIPIVLTSE